MTADINILKEGIEGLIRAGYYENREALREEAFRTMIEVKPSIRLEMAAEFGLQFRWYQGHSPCGLPGFPATGGQC
jgi:hypothetical protein